MPENVKRPNLERSIKAELSRYEFENHVTCINVEELSVDGCLDCNGVELPDDCLEDCRQGNFNGRGKVRVPMTGKEDDGSVDIQVEFSGTFDVVNYSHDSRQFTTTISEKVILDYV